MHSIAAWQHWIVSIVTPLRCTLWSPKPGLGCTRPYCPGHAVGINSMGGSQTHQTPAAQSSAAMHSVTGTLSNENVAWLPWAQSWAVAGEISASAAKAKARYSMLKMKGTACGARMELSTVQVVGSIERHVVRQDAGSPSCAGDGVLCSEAVGVAGTDVRQLGGGEWAAKCDQRNRIIASFLNRFGIFFLENRNTRPGTRVPLLHRNINLASQTGSERCHMPLTAENLKPLVNRWPARIVGPYHPTNDVADDVAELISE